MASRRAPGEGGMWERPDGKWEASRTIAYNSNGNPVRIRAVAKTKADASQKLLQKLKERGVAPGVAVGRRSRTVRSWATEWLVMCEDAGLKPDTVNQYRTTFRLHINPHIGDVDLATLRPGHIKKLLKDLKDSGQSASTTHRVMAILRTCLRQAIVNEHLASDPTIGQKLPKRETTKAKAWSSEDLKTFLEAARESGLWTLFLVAATTGARLGELRKLRWEDVDLNARTISVQSGKTEAAARTITLAEDVADVLKAQQQDSGLVWGGIHQTTIRRQFEAIIKAAGLPRITFHGLRHTFASVSLQEGVPLTVVSQKLGHSSPHITLKVYAHCLPSDEAKWTLGLGGIISHADGKASSSTSD